MINFFAPHQKFLKKLSDAADVQLNNDSIFQLRYAQLDPRLNV